MDDPAIRWLRVSYWAGAVADGVATLVMFGQAAFGTPSALNDYVPDVAYRYAMGLAASLMLGWTILLVWADRRPVERRGVLPITIVLIVGLIASGLGAVAAEFVTLAAMLPILVLQAALIILFAMSYFRSRAA